VPANLRLHSYSLKQPDCTPKGTLGYYAHVSTEPLRTIIVITLHFTNTFTHTLVFISHRHNQNPSPTNRHQGSTVIPTRNPRVVVTTKRKCYMHTTKLRHTLLTQETLSHPCDVKLAHSTAPAHRY
jgi:hypothetical protein